MHKLVLLAIVGCASAVFAQTDTRIYHNVATGATTRGAIGVNTGQQLSRIDAEDYNGIGDPVLTGGLVTGYTINGFQYVMQDQNDATPETYSVYFYSESAATPNFPDFLQTDPIGQNALNGPAGFGPFTQASTGTGVISAYIYTLNFTTTAMPPVTYPAGRDFFMAISHPAAPGWAGTDGGSVHINLGANPNFPPPTTNTYDLKGPGAIAGGTTSNSYGYAHNTTNGTLAAGGARQYHMIPLVLPTVGVGVATATTNQTSYPTSNAAPGTASFFSGLHPDGSSTPNTAGRVDDSYYVYFGAPAGNLVFFLVDFNTAPVTLPLAAFLAGSTGVYCLNAPSVLNFVISTGSGQDSIALLWSANARNFLLGQTFSLQGVAFDTAAGTLKGAPCATIR